MKDLFNVEGLKGKRINSDGFGGYAMFLHNIEKNVEQMPSFLECTRIMNEDAIISSHLNTMIGAWYYNTMYSEWKYLSFLILEQLYHHQSMFVFDENIFEQNYLDLEDFFYNEFMPMRYVLNLVNFNMEGKELRLSDDVVIRKIDKRDYRMFPTRDSSNSEYLVECMFSEKKLVGVHLNSYSGDAITKKYQEDEIIISKLDMAYNVLTLYKEGRVSIGAYTKTVASNVINLIVTRPPLYNTRTGFFRPYIIDTTEMTKIKSLYGRIKTFMGDDHKEFDVALRRLGLATYRYRYDDRLIDLAISYEALLYLSTERGELTHKLATRTAKLLGHDLMDRKEIFTFMKHMYGVRSGIVHGGSPTLKHNEINDFANYLRRVMFNYLSILVTMDHTELIAWLDLS